MSTVKRGGRCTSLVVVACALALPSSALALTDFTWTGSAPVDTPGWSSSSNWVGGAAPSGSVGTLTFPLLTSAACTASPPTATCAATTNDITGLNVNALSIDDGAQGSSNYQLSGNAITLGAGGLTASTTASSRGNASVRLPIVLGASQTWSIDGNNNLSQMGVYAAVTGPSANTLGITLSHQTALGLNNNDVEVGPVTITGASAGNPNGVVGISGGGLNATNGNPVSLTDAGIVGYNGRVGSLTSTRGQIQIGLSGSAPAGTLSVEGALTLDGATTVTMAINHAGTTAGTDYSQLSVTGSTNLANARLSLLGGGGSGSCPALTLGDVATLVSSPAGLTGTFAGIPDGTTVSLGCSPTNSPKLRINYTPQAVTATVVASSTSPPPPPVIGKTATVAPEKGRVLIKLPKGTSPKAYGLSAAAASGFVPLTAGATVPVGATLDTTHGQVRLTTAANAHSATQSGHFGKGVFTVQQGRKNPLTTLSMGGGGLSSCKTKVPPGGAPKQATAARRKRSLFSNVHGHFRSRGRNSAATARGTKWTMTDTCAGTLTAVTRGSVVVRDFRLRKNKVVKAGHKYLARAR
jgi:hypothetical protein